MALRGSFGNLRRNSEQPVDNTGTERYQQSIRVRETTRDEDVGAVVCNNVDTAELCLVSIDVTTSWYFENSPVA